MWSALVALLPVNLPDDLPAGARNAMISCGQELALRIAEVAASLNANARQLRQLRAQASMMTETLYERAQQLDQAGKELTSRNTELTITNEELRTVITDRERIAAERAQAAEELQQAFDREHRIAEVLQRSLIAPIPESLGDFSMAARYRAAFAEADVGGDFYHHARLGEDQRLIALGDVSGKGLEAAVYGSMAKYMMLGFASESPLPGTALFRLNEALSAQSDAGWFVTLIYLLFDLKSGKILYGNAGHEPAILYSAATGRTQELFPTGPALGILAGGEYKSRELTLEPGDSLLLYTDGLSDAGYRRTPFGSAGIARTIVECAAEKPSAVLDVVYDTATELSEGKLVDDAAAVLIKRER